MFSYAFHSVLGPSDSSCSSSACEPTEHLPKIRFSRERAVLTVTPVAVAVFVGDFSSDPYHEPRSFVSSFLRLRSEGFHWPRSHGPWSYRHQETGATTRVDYAALSIRITIPKHSTAI